MPGAHVLDCVNYMPERVVRNDAAAAHRGVRERRFASPQYTSGELGALAAKKLLDRNVVSPASIDLVIAASVLTDFMNYGIGADVLHRIGATNANLLNLDTNCTSWIGALNVARAFVESKIYKRILIVTVTNLVSRLTEFQELEGSWSLGDGASATLMVADDGRREGAILALDERSFGELYGHMRLESAPDSEGRRLEYWQSGKEPLAIHLSDGTIPERATRALPEAIRRVLHACDLSTSDVALLLTHQPDRVTIDGWRSARGIDP